MIDGVIRWSLHNRAAVIAVALVLTAIGVDIARRMPVDVFPDLTAPTVTVITEAHGMAPVEVESQVTFPIEAAVNGASGVRRVRSSTAVGISVVWVEFDWGTDIYAARQIVSEKVLLIAGDLPSGVGRPILAPISSIMGEILFLGLTSDRHSGIELRTVAETTLRRRLLSVPGVSQITPIGGGEKQYQVSLAPVKLQAYGLSLSQVRQALAASNENVSAGFLVSGGSEYLVTGVGRLRTSEDIAQVVVAAVDGVPIRIADLGVVRIDEGPKRGEGSINTQPGVILGVQKQPGANTLALTRTLDAVLDELQAKLPEGMSINRRLFRQADFIDVAIENVLHALRDGGILVILIVLLFLANIRATIITLTAIPLSLLVAVLALKAFGASINTMTLGGMAIAIGALVDDAVIDVENVFRRLRENALLPDSRRRPALQLVYEASVEIRSSIVFATLVILLVFLPLFFLAGVEGRLLQPLGIAYVVSLVASLIVAVTTTPVLCYILLPESKAVQRGEEPRLVRALKAGYAHILAGSLRAPWLVTVPAVLLLGVAVVASSVLGRAFLPDFNEGALTISAVTLPGTSLAESDALGRVVEKTLLAHPEVVSVARRTGRAELDEHAQGVEAAELDVALAMNGRSKAEFFDALRRDFSLIPGMNITIGQPISHRIDHMLSGTRANVAVKIFGPDLYTLRALGENARRLMATVPGVVDLSVEQQLDIPILRVRFERQALARHGVMVEDVAHTLEAALQGLTVSRVLEGQHAFDLVLRLHAREGWTPERLGDLLVDTPAGAKIPLRALADVTKTTGPNTISREQVERKIVVMCNVAERDVASVVRDIQQVVDPMIAGRPGYAVSYGGQFESAEEAGRLLSILGVAVIIGIAFLLYLAFGSARDAALVMVNLPLALIGGAAGVFISGGILSVASLIGFITVFGIATRNGIMLVSHIRHLQEHEGVLDFRDAVFRGSMERLAPILMTALATGLALIPLAIGGEKPGNEIQTPMAIVILFGLLTSMVLNMVIVPALYLRFGKPVQGTKEGGEAMSHALRLGTILVVFLVGCAYPPAREPPAPGGLRLPATERRESPNLGEAPVNIPLAATTPLGQRLAHLTLEDAFARAERFHPGLSAAEAEVQGAEGRALQAGLFPNPELVARTEAVPLSGSFSEQAEYIVGVSQPFPLGRRLSIARRVEGLDRDRLVHARDGKRWEVLMGVQSAFATALYWQRVIEARAEDVRLAENGVSAAKARLAAGDAIPAEVGQTEVELGRAQLDLERATSMQAQAMEALVTSMGEPSLEVGALEGGLEQPLVLPSLESLRARLEGNPAVAAAQADIAVQGARVELAEAQRMPDVNFELSYRRLGNVENALDVGMRLPIPLFNRFQGSIQEARAGLAAAEARSRLVRNELGRELQASHRTLARAVAAAKLLREDILPRAESVLQGAETRYRNGDISLAELLPIRRDWTRVRLEYPDALQDVTQAWAALSPYLY